MNPLGLPRRVVSAADDWQRRARWAGVPYAVAKKFGDDNANLLVVALAWYGFTAIFPLLLIVVTLFGFIGQQAIGTSIVSTLHEFPVVGSSFNPAGRGALHGSTLGLVVGLVGLLYGTQGVTQTAQLAMATVWNVPLSQRTGFFPRLGRSLAGLVAIGGAFVVNAFVTGYATGAGVGYAIRIPVLAGLLALNAALYFGCFTLLTAKAIGPRGLLPGAIAGAIAFTALITIGTGLINHQLRNASATYGAFGTVIGIVAFLLLLAKLTMYAAELNPVLARRLYPRALPLGCEPTPADRLVLSELVYAQQRRPDQVIGVGFGDDAAEQAASDATRRARPARLRRGPRQPGRPDTEGPACGRWCRVAVRGIRFTTSGREPSWLPIGRRKRPGAISPGPGRRKAPGRTARASRGRARA